jgi:hypothetical protein
MRVRAILAAMIVCAVHGACTDVRALKVDAPVPPPDFAVDVTVLTGRSAKDLPQAHLRQGKYTLLADGSLHSDIGDSLDFDIRPARTRWLYQAQVERVWDLARQCGYLDPSESSVDVWPQLVRPAPDEIIFVIWVRAGSADWWYVRRCRTSGVPDASAARFVRAMCGLAWVTDVPADRVLPQRYDFGPDPYAGFEPEPPLRGTAILR